ncbi:protein of unknown function [Candidatus Nitrosotalea okcheonensis]|uniref:Uncharacterized protein n=1 Tax=Candidatus Nitrosotalea okcheonensis TaxID=1903276 RepID=A0A2H1FIN9_9ARCH|nr:protein of unknown function [Candidatus Nitrosotalea okcheonensis]
MRNHVVPIIVPMTRKKMVVKDGSGARKYNTIPGIAKINQILSST